MDPARNISRLKIFESMASAESEESEGIFTKWNKALPRSPTVFAFSHPPAHLIKRSASAGSSRAKSM